MATLTATRFDAGELRAAACCVFIAGAFMVSVLGTGLVPLDSFGRLLSVYAESLGALAIVVGATALIVECELRRRAEGVPPSPFAVFREFFVLRWRRDGFVSVLTPPIVCMMILASFNAFKQLILPAAGFHFDATFAIWDRVLFAGIDPWRVTHAVFGSVAATNVIDGFYHGWFVPMTLGITVCAFLKNSELRTQYVLSYALSWIIIGSLLAWLLPAAGPCFYTDFAGTSSTFSSLMNTLQAHDAALVADGDGGLSALRNQAALLRHFNSGGLTLGGGISAMPSMHNALAVLFALGGMRISRILGYAMWGYAALIWIGSIHLGWHYAVDGPVAALLTIVIWSASGRATRALLNGGRSGINARARQIVA